MPDRDRDRGLADAAGADDGHEAMLRKFGCNLLDGFRSVQPSWRAGRAGTEQDGRCRQTVRAKVRHGQCSREAITSARDVDDIAGADGAITKGLAQCGDVEAQAAFVDIHIGPDLLDQLSLVHDLAGTLRKENENIERTAAEVKWSAVFLQ